MSRFLDWPGRAPADPLQLDSAACDPLVGDAYLEAAFAQAGPYDAVAAHLVAEDYGSEDDDAYWRELHLRQLAEGGGCDYDEYDPAHWIHKPAAAITPRGAPDPGPAARLAADFARIIGTRR